jgi:uncharacterized coiled-coil DUF342 family protein
MTTKKEIENEMKQTLENYKDKISELEKKFIAEKSQADPVNHKICAEKISSLKTALQDLEKELDAFRRADQQDTVDKVKNAMKSMMGDIDEEFRSSLAYFH